MVIYMRDERLTKASGMQVNQIIGVTDDFRFQKRGKLLRRCAVLRTRKRAVQIFPSCGMMSGLRDKKPL